eukprot:CAMPEP_0174861078 /NCGR_PEP_ID=MMETSP1114-20130205/50757_1 /TAXON_ID=312471 /ORGANISM="Neobodo designis, Strain CCAP 1951/1" /LENGTH=129 /DNA_ID=CAMNT_0016096073 /DNA_START=74 /DNA_END=461 /DNA_ORIENTATION=+
MRLERHRNAPQKNSNSGRPTERDRPSAVWALWATAARFFAEITAHGCFAASGRRAGRRRRAQRPNAVQRSLVQALKRLKRFFLKLHAETPEKRPVLEAAATVGGVQGGPGVPDRPHPKTSVLGPGGHIG